MIFADILDIHDCCAPEGSQTDILGDGFLMETNAIYRNIRLFSLEIGCQYIEAYPEYLLLPFHELPKIIASKKVPYVPSARLMKTVEASCPEVFTTQDLPMPESYHMHEAAHVIADHFLKNIKTSSQQEEILKSMLAESFANTVDALACIMATDDIHYFFIKQNCYMHPQKKVIQAMNGLIESLGFSFVSMLTFFTYLHANFLSSALSDEFIHELAQDYGKNVVITPQLKKYIATISEIGEKLDPLFRVTTTGNYLKQQGYEGDIHDLLDFPFIKIYAGKKEFKGAVEALLKTIG